MHEKLYIPTYEELCRNTTIPTARSEPTIASEPTAPRGIEGIEAIKGEVLLNKEFTFDEMLQKYIRKLGLEPKDIDSKVLETAELYFFLLVFRYKKLY